MASIFSHTAISIVAVTVFRPSKVPKYFLSLAIFISVIPDIDLVGFLLGIPYPHFFGHRGFTHSIFFALLLSGFIFYFFCNGLALTSRERICLLLFFGCLSVSHGLLDALTKGSIGVALLSPFENSRYFFWGTPISPIKFRTFLYTMDFKAIKSELLIIWIPSLLAVSAAMILRYTHHIKTLKKRTMK